MGKRILVLSAAVGAGHLRAAQAVELALKEMAPDAHVENVDVLTLTNALFRRLYGTSRGRSRGTAITCWRTVRR